MKKLNPFVVKCFLTANWRYDYPISMRTKDVAEASFRELHEGDYNEIGLRDTTDEIKKTVKDWLLTDSDHVKIWSKLTRGGAAR